MTFNEKILSIDKQFTLSKELLHGPSEFKAIIEKYKFNVEEMAEHLLYPENFPYGRKCAFRSDNFEVIVMNWKPLQSSNIHDHGNSFGCVYSVTGKANNVLYNENLDQLECIPLVNNTIAEVPKGNYHVIENKNEDYAVSLHFYAPPMNGMKVIDSQDNSRAYFVKSDTGAWDSQPDEVI